jgi:alkylation response protein AidB-like acyl-CoA dehydrogenase
VQLRQVGLSAACLGKRGFQESLLYAQERHQGGRSIIEYPDVKRMLLLQVWSCAGRLSECPRAGSQGADACRLERAHGQHSTSRVVGGLTSDGLEQKAYAEGAYALCIHAAALHDRAGAGDSEASQLLEVATELVKSWPSEWCLEGNKLAMQVRPALSTSGLMS